MADITKRGPDCDDGEGERGKRGHRGHRGHRGPAGPIGPTGPVGGQFPTEFTTPTVSKTIFVRPAPVGSDTEGDGSAEHPLATLQFAVTKVPFFIPADTRYFIDVTGINETLPPGFTLPAWKASSVIDFYGAFDVGNQFFLFRAAVNIVADPKPASTIPLADTVINVSDLFGGTVATGVSQDPITSHILIKLAAPRASWTTANLQGKQVVVATGGVANSTISQAITNDTIELNADDLFLVTFPIQIVEPGATFQVSSGDANGGLIANNIDSISFSGLKIVPTDSQLGLIAFGNGITLCQMCELLNPDIESVNQALNRTVRTWVYGFCIFGNATAIVNSQFSFGGFGGQVGVAPLNMIINRSTFDGFDPIETTSNQPGTPTFPAMASDITITDTAIRNGTGDGIIFHGGFAHLSGVDISSCNGNGITCKQGAGYMRIEAFPGAVGVGSSVANLGTYGIDVQDGMHVSVDASVSGLPPLQQLRGTSPNQVNVGNAGATTWANVAVVLNVPDFTGPTATGSRLSQDV